MQWYRADNAAYLNPVLIAGVTGSQYNSTPADNGKYVYAEEGGVKSNAIGPITPFAFAGISLTPLAVVDVNALPLGNNTNYTDPQGNVWTPNGAPSFTVATESNLPVIPFAGSGFISLRNTNPALWKKLHDATTDYTIIIQGRVGASTDPNAILGLLGTSAASNVNRGVSLFFDDRLSQSRSNALSYNIHNGTNASPGPVLNPVIGNAIKPNSLFTAVLTYTVAGTDNLKVYYNRSLLHTQTKTANAATTLDPTYAFEIGACGNGNSPLIGSLHFVGIYEGVLSENERQRIEGNRGITPDLPPVNRTIQTVVNDGRYNSFGTLVTINKNKKMYVFRSGTSHTQGGRVDLMDYDVATRTWSNRRTIYPYQNFEDIRDPRIGRIGQQLFVFFTRYTREAGNANLDKIAPGGWGYITSTDITGTTWNSFVSIPLPASRPNGTPWGKLVAMDTPGTFFQPFWRASALAAGAIFEVGYHKTIDSGTTWTDVIIHSNNNFHCTETYQVNCGGGRLLCVHRLENYWGQTAGLGQTTSTDDGATWSALTRTNMGGNAANIPCLYYDAAKDTITCLFQARTDGWLYASAHNPVAAVMASATGWKTPLKYEFNHATPNTSTHVGLGYPDFDGHLVIWADEDSAASVKLLAREESFAGMN